MEKIIQQAFILDYAHVLTFLLQKAYNHSELDSLIYGSNYQRLGGGVIDIKYLKEANNRKLMENIRKYHILIQTEEEYTNFSVKFKNEQFEVKRNETMNEDNWKDELRQAIDKYSPSTLSSKEKEHIFNLVVNCPSENEKMEELFWEVYDLVRVKYKVEILFNINPNIKINKNDFKVFEREKLMEDEKNEE